MIKRWKKSSTYGLICGSY